MSAGGPRRHPSTLGLLRWFEHGHLPPHLAAVSAPVGDLARLMVERLPDGPELTTGLRKLLEAKDALVRAAIEHDGAGPEHGQGIRPLSFDPTPSEAGK